MRCDRRGDIYVIPEYSLKVQEGSHGTLNPVLTLELVPSLFCISPGVSDVVEGSTNVQSDVGKSFVAVQVEIVDSELICCVS